MPTNWKKLYAMKKQAQDQLKKLDIDIDNSAGIYVFERTDENGVRYAYVGQAKKLEERLISHLLGYSQRIDISLKKRKLFNETKNPNGWKLYILNCKDQELNEKEQVYIKVYIEKGYQMYNKTLGSQAEGKVSINDGQTTKGYRDGLKQGYENCLKDIRTYFEKYLYYSIKGKLIKADGCYTKIAEKKLKEFDSLMKGKDTD